MRFSLLPRVRLMVPFQYLFIWVYDMPHAGETGGLFYPVAIHHLFVGTPSFTMTPTRAFGFDAVAC